MQYTHLVARPSSKDYVVMNARQKVCFFLLKMNFKIYLGNICYNIAVFNTIYIFKFDLFQTYYFATLNESEYSFAYSLADTDMVCFVHCFYFSYTLVKYLEGTFCCHFTDHL